MSGNWRTVPNSRTEALARWICVCTDVVLTEEAGGFFSWLFYPPHASRKVSLAVEHGLHLPLQTWTDKKEKIPKIRIHSPTEKL